MRTVQHRLAALFVAGAIGWAAPALALADGRVALVVGNAEYKFAGPLRTPANDAADLSAALKRLGFSVTTAVDAGGTALSDALAKFSDAAQGADLAFFWYGGHAVQFNEANHLLPVDAKLANEFALRRETFALKDIVRRIETSAKVNLVFIDASYETPLLEKLKTSLKTPERAATVGRGLARVDTQGRDTLVVFSAAPGEVVSQRDSRNSAFAEAMLKRIETPNVDIEVILKDVARDVRQITQEQQRPERLSRLESKVVLAADSTRGFAVTPTSPSPGANPAPSPEAARQSRDEAVEAEERRQKADQEAEAAALRKREAEEQARLAEERRRRFEEEAKRQNDEAVERRRAEALREAEEAEQRKRKAEQEAAAAEEKRRKAEEDAKAAEERARQAEDSARQAAGERTPEWLDELRERRERLEERREEWRRWREERRREAREWRGGREDESNRGRRERWERRHSRDRDGHDGRRDRWRRDQDGWRGERDRDHRWEDRGYERRGRGRDGGWRGGGYDR